jgi:hypothetical protein
MSDIKPDHDDLLQQIAVLRQELADCRQENGELQEYLGQRMEADAAAVEAWQAKTNSDFVWPQHADLVTFLLNQLEEERGPFAPGPVERLTRDLKTASVTLSDTEARFLVDGYYIMQEDRKRSKAQERALLEAEEPHTVISWFAEQSATMEKQLARALDVYTGAHIMGEWMRKVHGIGPILSAGILAQIYMGYWCRHCHGHDEEDCQRRQADKKRKLPPHGFEKEFSCPTVGHWWQFAGIAGDGQRPWLPNTKRPFNQDLKTLCWKVSDAFVKNSGSEKCYYGHVYRDRKEYEVQRNESGGNKKHVEERLARDKARGKPSKEAEYHNQGILSPGHIDLRARRYSVKLFLSHLHGEWYKRVTGEDPPLPYPIAHMGHVHFVWPPI